MNIFDFGAVPELITVLVSLLRFLVIEVNGSETKLGQRVEFRRLGNPIMIYILPQS